MRIGRFEVKIVKRWSFKRSRYYLRIRKWFIEDLEQQCYRRVWRWFIFVVSDHPDAPPSLEGVRLWNRTHYKDPMRGIPSWRIAPGGDA